MTPGDVEAVRRVYAAFNERAADRAAELISPEFSFVSEFDALFGRSYRGHSGFRQYLHDLAEVFATFHVDLLRAEAVRDVVLVAYRERAIGRGSGIEIDADGCEVWYFDELGRPLRFVNYASWEEAHTALDE